MRLNWTDDHKTEMAEPYEADGAPAPNASSVVASITIKARTWYDQKQYCWCGEGSMEFPGGEVKVFYGRDYHTQEQAQDAIEEYLYLDRQDMQQKNIEATKEIWMLRDKLFKAERQVKDLLDIQTQRMRERIAKSIGTT